jgi:hypothetical protein
MPVSSAATPRLLSACTGAAIAGYRQRASGQIRYRSIAVLLTRQQDDNKLRTWQQDGSPAPLPLGRPRLALTLSVKLLFQCWVHSALTVLMNSQSKLGSPSPGLLAEEQLSTKLRPWQQPPLPPTTGAGGLH